MRLYSAVDLTGNLIMIEKLVLGEILTGDLSIFSPTRQPLRHQEVPFVYAPTILYIHYSLWLVVVVLKKF